MRKNTSKGVVVALVIVAIALSLLISKAFATSAYDLTFSCSAGGHGMNDMGGTGLEVDGKQIVPVNAATNEPVEYTVQRNGESIIMTITNGEEVKLQYDTERQFDFYYNGNLVDDNATTQGAISYEIGDKYAACTLAFDCESVSGKVLTYNVGETAVTVTVPEPYIINNKSITGNFNNIKNLTLTVGNYNPDTMRVIISGPDNYSQALAVNNGSVTLPGNSLPQGASFLTLIIEDTTEPDPGPGPQPVQFEGDAYFMWVSGDKLCYHRFTGLLSNNGSGYEMNYVNIDDITDESGNNGSYVWKQDRANWVLASDVEESVGVLKPEVDIEYVFGDGRTHAGVQLDPCCDNDGENSICSNGNMIFRTTIYRDGYEALRFPTSLDTYTYFPWFFDETFFSPVIDVSGTTASNPAVYKAYILNDTVTFEVGMHSSTNQISSVKPLNVKSDAVSVSIVDGVCKIKFHSRYYDHVVFEVTMANGSKYYVRVARLSIYAIDNFRPNEDKSQVYGLLSYPSSKSESDYEVVATVVKKDGTESTSVILAGEIPDDPRLEQPGKGLKLAAYPVDVDDSVAGVYFTVVNKGALEGDVYGGTFSGSGRGIYYDIEDDRSATFREMRYDM